MTPVGRGYGRPVWMREMVWGVRELLSPRVELRGPTATLTFGDIDCEIFIGEGGMAMVLAMDIMLDSRDNMGLSSWVLLLDTKAEVLNREVENPLPLVKLELDELDIMDGEPGGIKTLCADNNDCLRLIDKLDPKLNSWGVSVAEEADIAWALECVTASVLLAIL